MVPPQQETRCLYLTFATVSLWIHENRANSTTNKMSNDAAYPPCCVRLRHTLPVEALVFLPTHRSICHRAQENYIYPPERAKYTNGGLLAETPPAEPKRLVADVNFCYRALFKRTQQPPEGSSVDTLIRKVVDHPQREFEVRKRHRVDRPQVDVLLGMVLFMGVEIHPCDLVSPL